MAVIQQNKYLTFLLNNENYGIPILKVKEIIGIMTITHIPRMPEYVKGVINLRGKIIPIVDLRLKFEMTERSYDDRTCIIVTEINTSSGAKLSGLVVDTVSEVLDINPENIEPSPQYGGVVEQEYLTGMGKVKEKVVLLLDSDKVMTDKEKDSLGAITKEDTQNKELKAELSAIS